MNDIEKELKVFRDELKESMMPEKEIMPDYIKVIAKISQSKVCMGYFRDQK